MSQEKPKNPTNRRHGTGAKITRGSAWYRKSDRPQTTTTYPGTTNPYIGFRIARTKK